MTPFSSACRGRWPASVPICAPKRAQLDREPANLALALTLAERYIALGRAESDPRFYGYAEGVLRPWASIDRPPPDVLVMRATLAQYRHDFAAASSDLDDAIAVDPGNARAWLTLATVDRVQGRYAGAGEACSRLFRLAPLLVTFTCLADVGSLHGHARENYTRLRALYQDSRNAGGVDPPVRIWTLTVLAETRGAGRRSGNGRGALPRSAGGRPA